MIDCPPPDPQIASNAALAARVLPIFQAFLQSAPLYQKSWKNEVEKNLIMSLFPRMPSIWPAIPHTIEVLCGTCKRSRPFRLILSSGGSSGGGAGKPSLKPKQIGNAIEELRFRCEDCQKRYFVCWLEVDSTHKTIRKLGQVPPPWELLDVPADLEQALGADDTELYKRAISSAETSFGIGACAYSRRILENKLYAILEMLLRHVIEEGASQEKIETLEKVIKGRRFDEKAAEVYKVVPDSLKVKGVNPFKLFHECLSGAIHASDETTAATLAKNILAALRFVIVRLKFEQRSRSEFEANLKSITEFKG